MYQTSWGGPVIPSHDCSHDCSLHTNIDTGLLVGLTFTEQATRKYLAIGGHFLYS